VGATAAVRTGHPYPTRTWTGSGKRCCCHQFHDILPGSSIAWVTARARATYRRLADELEAIIERPSAHGRDPEEAPRERAPW